MEREGVLGHDTGWQEVTRKKKRQVNHGGGRLDVATSARKISYDDTISFYFSNFPGTHGAKEMLRAFKLYGEAMEVVIPPKRDKWGKRFGFVRFGNVEDPRVFAIKLDNIIFGASKIHVNVPRFQREWKEDAKKENIQKQRFTMQNGGRRNYHQQKLNVGPQNIQQQRRIQKVWRKKEGGGVGGREKKGEEMKVVNEVKNSMQKIVYHRKNNVAEICHTVAEEEMQNFKKMYVGTVKTPGSTYYVHEWFHMQRKS